MNKTFELTIDSQKIATSFFLFVCILTLINSIVLVFYFYLDDSNLYGLVRWFDFSLEYNIPSFYSSFALLLCAILLFLIYVSKKENYSNNSYWLVLSVIFTFLSADEAFTIHENIGDLVESLFVTEGFFYFPWVIPYGIGLAIFILLFARFLIFLPRKFLVGFMGSGVIYIFGVMGLEMYGAREAQLHGTTTSTYCILYTFEEFFEMSGIVLFMYTLLCYVEQEIEYLQICKMTKIYFISTPKQV